MRFPVSQTKTIPGYQHHANASCIFVVTVVGEIREIRSPAWRNPHVRLKLLLCGDVEENPGPQVRYIFT